MELRMTNWILTAAFLLADVSVYVMTSSQETVTSQIPVFGRPPGYLMVRGTRSARVLLDVYIDLQCPDSAAIWPIIQKVALHYDPLDVSVVLHQMPLSWHMNAFLITQGYHQVQHRAPQRLQSYVSLCFHHLDEMDERTHPEWGMDGIISYLSRLQEPHTGIPAADFAARIPDYKDITRAAWKHGVSRGVAGTPWYFVNDINIGGVPPYGFIDYPTWLKILDHLLQVSDWDLWNHGVKLWDLFPPVAIETKKVTRETNQINDSAAAAQDHRSSSKKCRSPKTWKKYLQHLLKKGYYLVKYQKK